MADGPQDTGVGRHAEAAVSTPAQVAWRFVRRGRVHYLPLLLSERGRDTLVRKMDAFATDNGYTTEPRGQLGPLGRAVDRMVIGFPMNVGLRQRLDLVTDALATAVRGHAAAGADPVRVLSAPCGLIRDLLHTAAKLDQDPAAARVEWTGVDIDQRGDVLPEARRRADAAGLPITLLREDLFAERGQLADQAAAGGFHVINCIGLTAWLDLPDVARLAARLAELAAPGATLVVDNWHCHRHSHLGPIMEIPTRYHPDDGFREALERAGFGDWQVRRTGNGAVSVWVGRRTTP